LDILEISHQLVRRTLFEYIPSSDRTEESLGLPLDHFFKEAVSLAAFLERLSDGIKVTLRELRPGNPDPPEMDALLRLKFQPDHLKQFGHLTPMVLIVLISNHFERNTAYLDREISQPSQTQGPTKPKPVPSPDIFGSIFRSRREPDPPGRSTDLPPSAPRAPSPPSPPDHNCSVMKVFYATDRLQKIDRDGTPTYKSRRSPSGHLTYGVCGISIPKIHRLGKFETPSILKLEFRPDPEKHIVLVETLSMEQSAFLEDVKKSVAQSLAKEAFVFIHGYKVTFEDAARRTGQIAFDLHFVGAPIFYSWPSGGKLAAYFKDEDSMIWSTPHFQRFLGTIAQHSGAERIHIIAHSMGNRAVCDALKILSSDPGCNLKFNHLVLAAPDIDADTFRELAATLQRLSGRITLYESSKDKAMQASKKIHGNPRAGEPLLVIPGLDTIDASAIDTDFLGHSYFSDSRPLLSDIYQILSKDTPPAERFGLKEMDHASGKYYAFRA
jgi:esterase/lipase superfamily enzyme